MAGLSLLGYASTAFAGDYRYAHKAGVSASMIESDESECFEAAKLAMHKPSAPNPYNPATQSTAAGRSEEHTSELQSLMRTSYAVFCLKKTQNVLSLREHTFPYPSLSPYLSRYARAVLIPSLSPPLVIEHISTTIIHIPTI